MSIIVPVLPNGRLFSFADCFSSTEKILSGEWKNDYSFYTLGTLMNPKFISPGNSFSFNFKLIFSAIFSTSSHICRMHSKHNISKLSICSSTNPGWSSCSHCVSVNGNFFSVALAKLGCWRWFLFCFHSSQPVHLQIHQNLTTFHQL